MPRLLAPVLAVSAAVGALGGASAFAASTPTRVGIDAANQVSFSLTGRALLVTLRPVGDQPNALAGELSGAAVQLACRGTSPTRHRASTANTTGASWPAGATSLQVRLSRDVSQKPVWCLIERPDGTDIAVTFKLRIPRPAGA